MPKRDHLISSPIDQSLIINKLVDYLTARNRELLLPMEHIEEGLCAGIVSALFEDIFYHAMHPFYANQNEQSKQQFDANVTLAINHFYSKVQSIILTSPEYVNSEEIQHKIATQFQPEWSTAYEKLQTAIDRKEITVSKEDKEKFNKQFKESYLSNSKPIEEINYRVHNELDEPKENTDYFIHLVNLAEKNKVLSSDEASLLRDNHVPDIPYFENFITRVLHHKAEMVSIILDEPLQYKELDKLFANLHADSSDLPVPIREYDKSIVLDKNDFIGQLASFLPPERLARIVIHDHAVAAMNTGSGYIYVDPNKKNVNNIFCGSIYEVIISLCLSNIQLIGDKQTEVDPSLIDKFQRLVQCLNDLQNTEDDKEKELLFSEVIEDIPDFFTFSIECYAHPNAAPYHYPQPKSIADISALSYFVDVIKSELPKEQYDRAIGELDDHFNGYLIIKECCKKPYSKEQYELIKSMLASGALVMRSTKLAAELLMNACLAGNAAVVHLLLQSGADATAMNGRTSPFMIACADLNNPANQAMLASMMQFNKSSIAKALNVETLLNLIQANIDVSPLIPTLQELAKTNNISKHCLMLYNNKNILSEPSLAKQIGLLFQNVLRERGQKSNSPMLFSHHEDPPHVKCMKEIVSHLLSQDHLNDTPREIMKFLETQKTILGSPALKNEYDFSRFLITQAATRPKHENTDTNEISLRSLR